MPLPSYDEIVDPKLPSYDELAGPPKSDLPAYDDLVSEEAQKATMGALQAVDVMAAPGQLDWSDVNEGLDQQRLQEAEGLKAQALIAEESGETQQAFNLRRQRESVLGAISPYTVAGQSVLGQEQAQLKAIESQSVDTPSVAGFLGAPLASQVQPVADSVARNLGPASGGAAGAALYAVPGTAPARIGLGLLGAFLGSQTGAYGQEAVLQATESPEQTQERQERWEVDRRANPGANIAGMLLAQRPFFGVNPGQVAAAMTGNRAALKAAGTGAMIGAGSDIGLSVSTGNPIDTQSVIASAIGGAFMNEPTALGRRMGFPSSPAAVADILAPALREAGAPQRTSISEVITPAPDRVSIAEAFPRREAPEVPIQSETPQLIGTAVRLPDGTPLRGDSTTQPHTELSMKALESVDPKGETDYTPKTEDLGFAVKNPDGTETFVDRTKAMDLAKEQGTVPEDHPAKELTSEILKESTPPAEPPPTTPETAPAPKENITSIRNAQVDAERAQRGLPPMEDVVPVGNKEMMRRAAEMEAADPRIAERLITELKNKPRTLEAEESFVLLRERVRLNSEYLSAGERLEAAQVSGDENAIRSAQSDAESASNKLVELEKAAGKGSASTQAGRALQARAAFAAEDFSVPAMRTDLIIKQKGAPLSDKQETQIKEQSRILKETQEVLNQEQAKLNAEESGKSVDEVIASHEEKVDPVVKSLADRIIAKLDLSAENAAKSLRGRLSKLGAAPDPLIILDVAKIAAARTAKGAVKFAQWSAEMIEKFGEKVRPFLQAGWDQREQHIDTEVGTIGGSKKKEVGARVKKTPTDQLARIETAIGNRIKEGKGLGPYVKKLAENFVKSGINQREPLIDAVHQSLQKFDGNITREQARDLISGYGESTQLSKEPAKVILRDLKGQMQQISKLEALAKKEPLKKTGPQRRDPSVDERKLIKEVNAAKKKYGVVVTDPEKQLKSTLDSARTRLRNEIEDMTLEIETGVKRPEQTPQEYTQDIEILKGLRDRVRATLAAIDGPRVTTDAQRIDVAKRGLETAISALEKRLAGHSPQKGKKTPSTPEIEALRAKRDALKAQLDEVDSLNAVLQEEKKAQTLVRAIESAEKQLVTPPKGKTQTADTELVSEARAQLKAVRVALTAKRDADPARQQEIIDRAEKTLEKSIERLNAQLEVEDLSVNVKPTKLQSERLEYLRAQKAAMTKLRNQLRNEARPKLSAAETAIRSRITYLKNNAAELRRRMAAGDFTKKDRKPLDLSSNPVAVEALADNTIAREQFAKMKYEAERAARGKAQKAWDATKDTVDATTNLLTSFDLSAVRQGILAVYRNTPLGLKNIKTMVKAFASEAEAREVDAKIRLRRNAQNGNYDVADLAITPLDGGSFTAKEENTGARIAEKLPGVRMSNRAFQTFLNKMRADTMDALIDMHPTKSPTPEELKALGSYVNVATGRGNFGKFAAAIPFLGRVYWSPRLLLSRIQYLAGQPFYKGTAFTRKVIAKEYARQMTGIAAMYTLAQVAGWDVGLDERSSDFGRIITPDGTRIDPLGGLAQVMTLTGRLYHGETVDTKKEEVHSIIDDQSRYNTDAGDVLARFNRSKLNPTAGVMWDIVSRRLYTGEPTTGADVAKNILVPLSIRDIPENVREQGLSKALALWLLNTFGISAKTYEPK